MGSKSAPFERQSVDTLSGEAVMRYREQRQQQTQALAHLDCLRGVAPDTLARMAACATLRAFMPGTVITNEQHPLASLMLIVQGAVSLTLHDRAGREVLIGILERGDCLGVASLFGDRFRGATVRAETVCYLVQIPLADVRTMLPTAPELERALRQIYQQRLVESTLGRVPLFSRLSPVERIHIARALRPMQYSRGSIVLHQGAIGDALYIVMSGQVVVEQNGQAIAYLEEGDFFGEMSLLTRQPHNADVRALTPVEALALPAQDLDDLLASQPELAKQLRDVVEQRKASSRAIQSDVERQAQLMAMLEHGWRRGTHVLVRDLSLCKPGCTICEHACASRHGSSRIHFSGLMLNGMEVANACRQCRVGAECVEACPEDAIVWNDSGALMITDACTGCGECVPACPYDAVHLKPVAAAHQSSLWGLWQRWQRWRTPVIHLEAAHQPHQRAHKCDLCHGYHDLACVSACPTGALRLAPVEEVFPL
ncbi:cyclic nucleotide-binding domain-containing protein [Roseiflexus castenholzii]|jgi:CRP-like cAMP-binding protein/Na+-translocating ferredoxin:NAD+ oxidoreductase RNF subunit RnfB|uniref:Cyclic nucleotide-binding protein n=1 Tax=Roseiflexus castenholzii (strain DSM 13941 / HLO8) TaxID=383372 RepID=A7NN24_ROSCS|nr:cyclic nucleotide-binding domain-containing protein [Roseiflexus castenholzii]ABU58956.1 cyclic nucleotide-binding protein [Roseiflexus castenholzii DSM 13941]